MLHYFPVAILVSHRGTSVHHTRLCNFARNISANISALGQRTSLKLRELTSLFIFHNITISWLYPLNGFWFKFLLRDGENTLYSFDYARRSKVLLHSHGNKVKQSPLIDRWPIVFENVINLPCFVQVNHLLLCKSYEKTSGELT